MESPLVSVIIPAYNEERNISCCIEALSKQTYSQIEIIVVDDGSTDGTLDICRMAQKNDERVRVYSQTNAGVSAARNHGLEAASGDWLLFVDADDELPDNAVEDLLRTAMEHHCLVVQGCLDRGVEKACRYSGDCKVVPGFDFVGAVLDEWHFTYGNLSRELISSAHGCYGKLFNRDMMVSNHITFDTTLRLGEDMLFSLEAYTRAGKIGLLDKVVYRIKQNPCSSTRRHNREMLLSSLDFSLKLSEKMQSLDLLPRWEDERDFICFSTVDVATNIAIFGDRKLTGFKRYLHDVRTFYNQTGVREITRRCARLLERKPHVYETKYTLYLLLLKNRQYMLYVWLKMMLAYREVVINKFKRGR